MKIFSRRLGSIQFIVSYWEPLLEMMFNQISVVSSKNKGNQKARKSCLKKSSRVFLYDRRKTNQSTIEYRKVLHHRERTRALVWCLLVFFLGSRKALIYVGERHEHFSGGFRYITVLYSGSTRPNAGEYLCWVRWEEWDEEIKEIELGACTAGIQAREVKTCQLHNNIALKKYEMWSTNFFFFSWSSSSAPAPSTQNWAAFILFLQLFFTVAVAIKTKLHEQRAKREPVCSLLSKSTKGDLAYWHDHVTWWNWTVGIYCSAFNCSRIWICTLFCLCLHRRWCRSMMQCNGGGLRLIWFSCSTDLIYRKRSSCFYLLIFFCT